MCWCVMGYTCSLLRKKCNKINRHRFNCSAFWKSLLYTIFCDHRCQFGPRETKLWDMRIFMRSGSCFAHINFWGETIFLMVNKLCKWINDHKTSPFWKWWDVLDTLSLLLFSNTGKNLHIYFFIYYSEQRFDVTQWIQRKWPILQVR